MNSPEKAEEWGFSGMPMSARSFQPRAENHKAVQERASQCELLWKWVHAGDKPQRPSWMGPGSSQRQQYSGKWRRIRDDGGKLCSHVLLVPWWNPQKMKYFPGKNPRTKCLSKTICMAGMLLATHPAYVQATKYECYWAAKHQVWE